MKNKKLYFGLLLLLLLVIFAVFTSFYHPEQLEYFELRKSSGYNSPYVSCSSYTADKCPSKNCMVKTDERRCASAAPSNLPPGVKNYNIPSSYYTPGSSSGYSSCGSAGYLKSCVTKSLQ